MYHHNVALVKERNRADRRQRLCESRFREDHKAWNYDASEILDTPYVHSPPAKTYGKEVRSLTAPIPERILRCTACDVNGVRRIHAYRADQALTLFDM